MSNQHLFKKVQRLLLSDDIETVEVGLELIETISEEEPDVLLSLGGGIRVQEKKLVLPDWLFSKHAPYVGLTLLCWMARSGQRSALRVSKLQLPERQEAGRIPVSICHLTELTELRVKGWKLTSLPAEIGKLEKLRILDLYDNQLTELPSEICSLSKLRRLYLSNNQIKHLPEQLGDLQKLWMLTLHGNKIEDLPKSLGRLQSLEHLDLQNNNLRELPDFLFELEELKFLALGGNGLQQIPEHLGRLSNLKKLHLTHNRLEMLPESIGSLRYLRVLKIEHNRLAVLPESMVQLHSLREFGWQNNLFEGLPPSLYEYLGKNDRKQKELWTLYTLFCMVWFFLLMFGALIEMAASFTSAQELLSGLQEAGAYQHRSHAGTFACTVGEGVVSDFYFLSPFASRFLGSWWSLLIPPVYFFLIDEAPRKMWVGHCIALLLLLFCYHGDYGQRIQISPDGEIRSWTYNIFASASEKETDKLRRSDAQSTEHENSSAFVLYRRGEVNGYRNRRDQGGRILLQGEKNTWTLYPFYSFWIVGEWRQSFLDIAEESAAVDELCSLIAKSHDRDCFHKR